MASFPRATKRPCLGDGDAYRHIAHKAKRFPSGALSISRSEAQLMMAESSRDCAQISCDAYRDVVRKNDQFIEFFQAVTPVQELGRMNIGSRPAKRKAAGSIDDLRAIPWIFAWTQIRFHLPVWLGIGQAFEVLPSTCQALQRLGCSGGVALLCY